MRREVDDMKTYDAQIPMMPHPSKFTKARNIIIAEGNGFKASPTTLMNIASNKYLDMYTEMIRKQMDLDYQNAIR